MTRRPLARRTPTGAALLAAAFAVAASPSIRADDATMGAEQLDALVTGNTVYIDVPAGGPMGDGGEMPLFYGVDGTVHARLPTGVTMEGVYTIDGDRYCVDWNPAPKNSCTSIVRAREGGFALVDPVGGDRRGTLTRLAPGNVESLGS